MLTRVNLVNLRCSTTASSGTFAVGIHDERRATLPWTRPARAPLDVRGTSRTPRWAAPPRAASARASRRSIPRSEAAILTTLSTRSSSPGPTPSKYCRWMLRSGRITVNRRTKTPGCCDILSTRQADVAQQVEQLTRNEQVSGSSPLVGSLILRLPVPNTPRKG